VEKFGEIIDADDKRIPADRELVDEMRGTLMELGLVRVTEAAVHLLEDRTLQELEKKRQLKTAEEPSVGELRRWIDEGGKMGLQVEASDLVVRCFARWAARTLVSYGKPYEAKAGQPIPDDVVLEKPDLPGQAEWSEALRLAGAAFGVTLAGKALYADNLKRFEALLADKLSIASACAKLPGLLGARLGELGLPENADRMRTALSADRLCAVLQGKRAVEQVRALAVFQPETGAQAVGRSIAKTAETMAVLDDRLVFGVFGQLRARRTQVPGAEELLERAAQALRQDQVIVELAPRLRALAEDGQRMLTPPESPIPPADGHEAGQRPIPLPEPGVRAILRRPLHARGRAAALETARVAFEEIAAKLESGGDDVTLSGEIVLWSGPKTS
jgi:hypothetical protein